MQKTEEIKKMKDEFEVEKKEIVEEIEFCRNEWHVTQMLFVNFKERMKEKYLYDINDEDRESDNEPDENCSEKGKKKKEV